MKIILLGAPGVGKGTIAHMINVDYNLPHISTGDIFRENIKNQTEYGKRAKEYLDKGLLVPDDFVLEIINDRLNKEDCKKGFIFDGFPRTITQAEALSKMINIDYVINFSASEDTIVKRLSSRRTCKQCKAIFNILTVPSKQEGICDNCGGELYIRDDEKPEVIIERLKTYKEHTEPLIKFYKKTGLLKTVSAEPMPDKVFVDVKKIIS